jgi:predicted ATP-grasp superfamily ATP-dependent carboligase
MKKIVRKNELYKLARESEVPIPPSIVEPSIGELDEWCRFNKSPYFVKPYYEGIQNSALKSKNQVFENHESLLAFVEQHGAKAIIIQRMISGGDGWIFDCYGYCDSEGKVVTMASHRRIRQRPINTGTTCYGEIPATGIGRREEHIFDLTQKLLEGLGYHGIFGIEWLLDRDTGEFYVLDFNARPFLTINHLADCGLNLPYLAYRELVGEDISNTPLKPRLDHKTWMDFNRDFYSFNETIRVTKSNWLQWVTQSLACRSHAFWRARDPMPSLVQLRRFVARVYRKVIEVVLNRAHKKRV